MGLINKIHLNKSEDDIRQAIIDVGGTVYADERLCEYPDVIRRELEKRHDYEGSVGEHITISVKDDIISAELNESAFMTEDEVDSVFDSIFQKIETGQ